MPFYNSFMERPSYY